MGVPDYRFAGHFWVLAQELQGIDAGRGVVFLVRKFGALDGGLLLLAEAAIEDSELVVCGQIVGIDALGRS